jgi:hypothetical protein
MDGSKVDDDQSQFEQGDPDFDIHILNHAEQILFRYIPAIWKALCPNTLRYIRSTEKEAYVDSRLGKNKHDEHLRSIGYGSNFCFQLHKASYITPCEKEVPSFPMG